MTIVSLAVLVISVVTFIIASVGFWLTVPMVHNYRSKSHSHPKASK